MAGDAMPRGVMAPIPAAGFRYARFEWLQEVRHDARLSWAAKVIAAELALGHFNVETGQCDPSYQVMARAFDCSVDTVKRGVAELRAAGWIVRDGVKGQAKVPVVFCMTPKVARLSDHPKFAAKTSPRKGKSALLLTPEKGQICPTLKNEKGQICSEERANLPYRIYIAKPWKNHNAGTPARLSENPLVHRDAADLAQRILDRGADAVRDTEGKPWVLSHLIAADLLSETDLAAAGVEICYEEGAST